MIFPDYWTIGIVVICLFLCGGGVYLFRRTGSSSPVVKVPTRLVSGLVVACSVVALGMFGCASAWNVTAHSIPIYSPDRQRALRITDTDSGALGGFTNITLYSHHGLIGRNVFSGDWRAVEPRTVRWINDSQVVIRYDASYIYPPACNSASGVSVRCEPVTYTYPH